MILGILKIFSLGSGGIRRRKGRKGDREERRRLKTRRRGEGSEKGLKIRGYVLYCYVEVPNRQH